MTMLMKILQKTILFDGAIERGLSWKERFCHIIGRKAGRILEKACYQAYINLWQKSRWQSS